MRTLLLLVMAVAAGCAGSYRVTRPAEEVGGAEAVLDAYLSRGEEWRSLSCRVKIKLQLGDSTIAARGTLMYLSDEKYSLSFVRPYNQVLGDLYVTPSQLVYWGNGRSQTLISAEDTVKIEDLMPFDLPDWDPRDLLPFPASGRTGGFQVTSIGGDAEGLQQVTGESGSARYTLTLNTKSGVIKSESVTRQSHELVLKTFYRTRDVKGRPIAARVRIEDPDGRVRLTWQLSDIELTLSSDTRGEGIPLVIPFTDHE